MRFTIVAFIRSLLLFTSLHSTHAGDETFALALQQEEYARTFEKSLSATFQDIKILSPQDSPQKTKPTPNLSSHSSSSFEKDANRQKRTHSESESEEEKSENESENSEDTISRDEILRTLQDPSKEITIGLVEDLLSLPFDEALDIPALKMMLKRCPELADEKKLTALDLTFLYHSEELPPALVKVFLEAKINPYREYDPGDGKATSFAKNIKESELSKQNKRAIFSLIKKYYPNFTDTKAPKDRSHKCAQADASALGHFDLHAFGKGGQRTAASLSQSPRMAFTQTQQHLKSPHFYVPLSPNFSPFKEKLRADCEKHMATSKETLFFDEFAAILEAFSEDTPFIEELLRLELVNAREIKPESRRTHLDSLITFRKNDLVNLGTLKALLHAGVSPYHQGWGGSFMERIANPLTGVKNRWEIEMIIEEINDRNSYLSF